MLRLTHSAFAGMIAHALDGVPDEACGLMVGSLATESVVRFVPCRNAAASARVYTVDPRDYMRAEREAEHDGFEIVGVMHSHTHTTAYPSPTDVEAAPDPAWHYLIVSLRDGDPVMHSYRIIDGSITEETIARGDR
jgi:proteasome lid subunit RPN8/RPN11